MTMNTTGCVVIEKMAKAKRPLANLDIPLWQIHTQIHVSLPIPA